MKKEDEVRLKLGSILSLACASIIYLVGLFLLHYLVYCFSSYEDRCSHSGQDSDTPSMLNGLDFSKYSSYVFREVVMANDHVLEWAGGHGQLG